MYKIPLMKNAFVNEKETKDALAEFIVNTNQLSMGFKCFEFETQFALKQNRKYAILFNSGASANLALLQSLKNLGCILNNEKVGFTALTWATNVMPIIQQNLIPVPIDVETSQLNSTSTQVLQAIRNNKDMKMLFLTNVMGFMGDLNNIRELCKDNNIILLIDNCESLGTEIPQGKSGEFGLASTFSFYVAHHISTIEGGMVCTDNEELADMLKLVRANGWDRNLTKEKQKLIRSKYSIDSEFQAKYTFYDLGYNMRPTEITGFLGLNQLKYLDFIIEKRKDNWLKVNSSILNKENFLHTFYINNYTKFSPFSIPFVCVSKEIKESYIKIFEENGIETRPLIAGNMVKQPFYKKYVKDISSLPNTDTIHNNGFYCGNNVDFTKSDIDLIIDCLNKIK